MFVLIFIAYVVIVFLICVVREVIVRRRRRRQQGLDELVERAPSPFGEVPVMWDRARDVNIHIQVYGADVPAPRGRYNEAYYSFRDHGPSPLLASPVSRRDPDVDSQLPSYNDRWTTMPVVPPATYASPITLRREGTRPQSSSSTDEPPRYEQSSQYQPPTAHTVRN